MRLSFGRAAVLAFALGASSTLAACGGEPAEEATVEEDSVPEAEDVLANQAGPLEDPSQPLPVTLEPVNESGVEGRATRIQVHDSLQLSLMVQGLPRDGEYQAHIHKGTCESGGAVVVPLNPVKAQGDGMGRSLTTIPTTRLPAAEPHFVQVHGASGVLACGDVQGP